MPRTKVTKLSPEAVVARLAKLDIAHAHLKMARNLMVEAGCRTAAIDKVRHALKSLEGARRHTDGVRFRNR